MEVLSGFVLTVA